VNDLLIVAEVDELTSLISQESRRVKMCYDLKPSNLDLPTYPNETPLEDFFREKLRP
jgi:hypothetical protein